MTIKDVLKMLYIFFSGTPNQTTFASSAKPRVLFAINLLSSDNIIEIIGQSKKICGKVSFGAGSSRPPTHRLHSGSYSTTNFEIIALVYSVPVLNLNKNSQKSFVRKLHLKRL